MVLQDCFGHFLDLTPHPQNLEVCLGEAICMLPCSFGVLKGWVSLRILPGFLDPGGLTRAPCRRQETLPHLSLVFLVERKQKERRSAND